MSVGFIGLGNLGSAMARRLATEGTDLLVWNRTRSKAEAIGLPIAENPAEIARRCETIILNLFDSAAVREVLGSASGLLAGDLHGKTVIDTTTNHFRDVLEFHEMVRSAGGNYLESPVLGSVVPASQGALTILTSGERTAYDKAKSLYEKMGRQLFFLEKPGLASKMKLINNLVLGTFMGVLAEATVLGERAGLAREQVLDILAAGAGNSAVLNAKRQKLLSEDFSPHFSVAAIYKDLRYVGDLLAEMSIESKMRPASEAVFRAASEAGLGAMDLSAVLKSINSKR